MRIYNKCEWPELTNISNLAEALVNKLITKDAMGFKKELELLKQERQKTKKELASEK